jgi:hypothetical protein
MRDFSVNVIVFTLMQSDDVVFPLRNVRGTSFVQLFKEKVKFIASALGVNVLDVIVGVPE